MLKFKLLAGAIVLAVGAPAAAQVSSGYQSNYQDPHYQIQQLRQRLETGIQTGRISQREAYTLRQELRSLRQLATRYSSNGLSRYERDDLNRRIVSLRERIRYSRRDNDYRGGYQNDGNDWDNDDEDYREGQWDERSGDWNDRDWEADRPDDNDWDDRDRWDERNPWNNNNNSGGYNGVQGTQPVPQRYRYLYRDTDRYYYRYRDGYVYQIDRYTHRTLNTVWVGR